MWPMMKGFARDFSAYRSTLGKQDAWIRRHAANKGWSVNPRWMVYTNLRLWLSDCEEMYGRRYCPCFEPSGDRGLDKTADLPVRRSRRPRSTRSAGATARCSDGAT